MTDENGKLTEEELETLKQWATKTFPRGMRCPLCQSNQWDPDMRLAATEFMTRTGKILEGRGLSTVSMQCEKCGFIANVNARIVGIV